MEHPVQGLASRRPRTPSFVRFPCPFNMPAQDTSPPAPARPSSPPTTPPSSSPSSPSSPPSTLPSFHVWRQHPTSLPRALFLDNRDKASTFAFDFLNWLRDESALLLNARAATAAAVALAASMATAASGAKDAAIDVLPSASNPPQTRSTTATTRHVLGRRK
ncbi:hypothetical protein Naga_100468g1 [Nannochloropsis gaditana]|uniref:Uncharacterized protein n=1 Tax=Nannochloropsis gaditana TaxID=72520 RepID=W7TLG6_9STRA|nr:hypothetical protein Naga_100468g1 [Nannochloropsis gaditana]